MVLTLELDKGTQAPPRRCRQRERTPTSEITLSYLPVESHHGALFLAWKATAIQCGELGLTS